MKVKALSCLCAAVCVLTCAAGLAQTRAAPTRYYTSTYGSPAGGHYYAGHHHGAGCTDCGVAGPSCAGDWGCGGPGYCHGCHRCCPRILPAVARGVGAVADFVGGTLDVIFCAPDGGCGGCGPRRGCCLRRPAWGGCGGCGSCGGCGVESDCCDGGMPSMGVPMDAVPSGPPMPTEAQVYRPNATTRAVIAPKTTVARKAPASVSRSSYAASQAAAQQDIRRSKSVPRELQVEAGTAVALNPFDDEVAPPVRVERTSVKAPSRSLPANPLRQ